MKKIYQLKSDDELSEKIISRIKKSFKSKPITIVVEDDDYENDITEEMKLMLDERSVFN